MIIAIKELKRLNSKLNQPDYVNEFAFKFYKKSFEMNLIKGRSIKGMVAACIYFACRINGIPITLNEILKETNETKKLVKLCFMNIIKNFNIKIPNMNPILFIPKYISKLNLDFEIEKLSIKILNICLNNNFFHGKKPKGICAGAIYLASKLKNLKINQKEICKLMGISEVTLRSRYKEIMTNIDMIFN